MNIIVTGASKGIGYELVKILADDGHEVIAISRDWQRLESLKDACTEASRNRVFPIEADITSLSSGAHAWVEKIFAQFGVIHALVNNAGSLIHKPFQDTSPEEVQHMMDVNFLSPALLVKFLSHRFVKGTHVVNISSMGGFQGSAKFPGLAYYSASKAALNVLTECLAEEYKEKGWRFNCLCLGAVQTEMLENAFPGYQAPVNAVDMARFIAKFTLDSGKFFNGKILPVSSSTP
jgi:3-oxoacyl-[acyl-carrier protein] reductase